VLFDEQKYVVRKILERKELEKWAIKKKLCVRKKETGKFTIADNGILRQKLLMMTREVSINLSCLKVCVGN
jgi:hypothetical protein